MMWTYTEHQEGMKEFKNASSSSPMLHFYLQIALQLAKAWWYVEIYDFTTLLFSLQAFKQSLYSRLEATQF